MAIHPIPEKQNNLARPDPADGHPINLKVELKKEKNPFTSAHQNFHANDYRRDVLTWMLFILILRNTIIPIKSTKLTEIMSFINALT